VASLSYGDNPRPSGLSVRARRMRILIAVGAAVLALGLTAIYLAAPVRLEHPAYDGTHSTLADVRYGWPYDWLSQDQRAMDPPAGNSQSFSDIRKCPTTFLWSGLAVNILALWIGLAISASALALLARTIRSRQT